MQHTLISAYDAHMYMSANCALQCQLTVHCNVTHTDTVRTFTMSLTRFTVRAYNAISEKVHGVSQKRCMMSHLTKDFISSSCCLTCWGVRAAGWGAAGGVRLGLGATGEYLPRPTRRP